MNVRRAVAADREILLDIWLRSVRATHVFLNEEDTQSLLPLVPDELAKLEILVLCSDADLAVGFMGISGSKMEALFLAPEFLRRGGGRRLVEHARQLYGELTVDV